MNWRYYLLLFILPSLIYAHAPKREFRAAWIATVFNIDWPSQQGLPVQYQKKELLKILDTLTNLKFNAAILQVKPASDAFYQSKYSPWSKYLTGIQGKSPEYDPLAFFISEAKKRQLETHIWVNPFRILASGELSSLAKSHVAQKNPSWVIEYNHRYYFDPGNPNVRAYLIKEIIEIVKNYDIDAIHMDDYFYPYKVYKNGKLIPFNDDYTWNQFGKAHFKNRDNWRRNNINHFIKQIYHTIKETKSYVQFGISPFGVWRNKSVDPKGSDTTAGQTNYDDLYADVLTWMKNGWVDYILPQIYWHFDTKSVPFDILVQWWKKHTPNTVNLYIGLGIYKLHEQNWPLSYIKTQIDYLRKYQIDGMSYYSAIWLVNNTKNIIPYIKQNINMTEAIVPITMNGKIPHQVSNFKLNKLKNFYTLSWKNKNLQDTQYYIIYRFLKNHTPDFDNPQNILSKVFVTQHEYILKNYDSKYSYGISVLSHQNYESPILTLEDNEKLESLEKINKILSQ